MEARRPAQWLKSRIRLQLLGWVVVPLALLPLWLVWRRPVWQFVLLVAIAFVLSEGPTRRQFRNWFVGARGEVAVAKELRPLEADGYVVVHDVSTPRGNIDHVVVGPTGVFVLETKAWRGRVYPGPDGRLLVNGHEQAADRQVLRGVMEVKRRLHPAGIRYWVEGLVVLTASGLPRGPIRLRHATVIERRDLVARIRAGRSRLDPHQVARVAQLLLA
jgi:Nuclease-related domain